MKLDAKMLRYLTSEDFRVLQGVLIAPPPRHAIALWSIIFTANTLHVQ
jgi:hypothetical protein